MDEYSKKRKISFKYNLREYWSFLRNYKFAAVSIVF